MGDSWKEVSIVVSWCLLLSSTVLTTSVAGDLIRRGGQGMRRFEEHVIDVAVERSLTRSKQIAASK